MPDHDSLESRSLARPAHVLNTESEAGSTCTNLAPTTIAEFDLIEVVGQGGFGKVWKARRKKTGNIYAIKIQRCVCSLKLIGRDARVTPSLSDLTVRR